MAISKGERELAIEIKKFRTLRDIMELIKEKPLSIAEIGRKLNINRSTLRYYLSQLKEMGQIKVERKEELAGRPSIVSLDKESIDKQLKEMDKKARKYDDYQKNSPYTKKILESLKGGRKTIEELQELNKKINPEDTTIAKTLSSLQWLKLHGYINELYELKK